MQKRPIRIEGDLAFVPLTKGYEAVIDAADAPLVEGRNWSAAVRFRRDGSIRTVYGQSKTPHPVTGKRTVMLHRVLLGAEENQVDHRDGDGLNCRRFNLRDATQSQNSHNQKAHCDNTSGAKGVTWHKNNRRWQAQIAVKGKNIYLGAFKEKADAQNAYAEASARLHGAFGRTK